MIRSMSQRIKMASLALPLLAEVSCGADLDDGWWRTLITSIQVPTQNCGTPLGPKLTRVPLRLKGLCRVLPVNSNQCEDRKEPVYGTCAGLDRVHLTATLDNPQLANKTIKVDLEARRLVSPDLIRDPNNDEDYRAELELCETDADGTLKDFVIQVRDDNQLLLAEVDGNSPKSSVSLSGCGADPLDPSNKKLCGEVTLPLLRQKATVSVEVQGRGSVTATCQTAHGSWIMGCTTAKKGQAACNQPGYLGTNIDLTATPDPDVAPHLDKVVWPDASCMGLKCAVPISEPSALGAAPLMVKHVPVAFQLKRYKLTVDPALAPYVTVMPAGSDYDALTTVTLTPKIGACDQISAWSGCTFKDGKCTVTLTGPTQISARLTQRDPVILTLMTRGTVTGTTLFGDRRDVNGRDIALPTGVSGPMNFTLCKGDRITLTASPANRIDSWEYECAANPKAATCTLIMDKNKIGCLAFTP